MKKILLPMLLLLTACQTTAKTPEIVVEPPSVNVEVNFTDFIYEGELGENDELAVYYNDTHTRYYYVDSEHPTTFKYKTGYLEVNYYDKWALPDIQRKTVYMGNFQVMLGQYFF